MIYTFYSFKGGVGRSMALANVAEVMYRSKLKVLMVDFDLEAPGLERYFSDGLPSGLTLQAVQEHAGIIELLGAYKKLFSLSGRRVIPANAGLDERIASLPTPKFDDYVIALRPFSTGYGSLSLLTSGSRVGDRYAEYAQQVLSFAWDDFYLNFEGEVFFEWFRREAEAMADVILIDSRTGVTGMSGVCTHQLADAVASFVAANQQNQQGTLRMAKSLANPELIEKGRRGRPLSQIFVPSRVEISEGDRASIFQRSFEGLIAEAFPTGVPGRATGTFDLAIPYVPYYAFDERVAVRDESHPLAKLIVTPITALTTVMASLAPSNSPVYLAYHSSVELVAKLADELVQSLDSEKQLQVKSLLGRLVRVALGTDAAPYSVARVPVEELGVSATMLDPLTRIGVVSVDPDPTTGMATATIKDPDLLSRWTLLHQWIEDDLPFLSWRQRISISRLEWEKKGGDGNLLTGTPLEESRTWLKDKRQFLNTKELVYIEASQAADQATAITLVKPIRLVKPPADLPVLTPIRTVGNQAAILFIHGPVGSVSGTWGEFPAFLSADARVANWDLIGISFDTSLDPDVLGLFRTERPLEELAELLYRRLQTPQLLQHKAMALMAHSLGGLVLQRTLVDHPELASRVSHVFLFGTPSSGLVTARLFSFLKRQLRDVGERSKFILDLRTRWNERFGSHAPFRLYAIAGDRDQFVPPMSSLEPFPPEQRFVVTASHEELGKPKSAEDAQVALVLHAVATGAGFSTRSDVIQDLWPKRDQLPEEELLRLALALDQVDRTEDAVDLLQGHGARSLEMLGLLAGRWKRVWLASRRSADGQKALELYSKGFELAEAMADHQQAFYHGINAAFMVLAYQSDLNQARVWAERVLEHCDRSPVDKWCVATAAEANLLLGNTQEALSKYELALNEKPSEREAESMYQQALRTADLVSDEEALTTLPVLFGQQPPPLVM